MNEPQYTRRRLFPLGQLSELFDGNIGFFFSFKLFEASPSNTDALGYHAKLDTYSANITTIDNYSLSYSEYERPKKNFLIISEGIKKIASRVSEKKVSTV